MSYGVKQSEIGELTANLVAQILNGARPADLPLEAPTRFEFLVNLKFAAQRYFTRHSTPCIVGTIRSAVETSSACPLSSVAE